jgi:hypothetical protein
MIPSVPDDAAIPESQKNSRSIGRRLFLLACGLAVIGITVFLVGRREPVQEPLVWLTPNQFSIATRPGPLHRFKVLLVSMAGPFRRFYRPNHANILIASHLVSLSADWEGSESLGAPTATNTDGTRAWILTENELGAFRNLLQTAPGYNLMVSPRVVTADGTTAGVSVTDTISIPSPDGSIRRVPVGLTMDLSPKLVSHAIRLVVGLLSTSKGPITNGAITIKTNGVVNSRVRLPNGGALILNVGETRPGASTNFWIIVSPTATDSKGQRVNL